MPGMDGIELARRLREAPGPAVPVAMLSAYDWSEYEHEARAAGVSAFIPKPLFRSDLEEWFRQLDGKSGEDRAEAPADGGLPSFSSRRVLLVEDNALNREIALAMLDMTGARVETAENGREALDMFMAAPPGITTW